MLEKTYKIVNSMKFALLQNCTKYILASMNKGRVTIGPKLGSSYFVQTGPRQIGPLLLGDARELLNFGLIKETTKIPQYNLEVPCEHRTGLYFILGVVWN